MEGKNFLFDLDLKNATLEGKIPQIEYSMLMEIANEYSFDFITEKLLIHKGTLNRWLKSKEVPKNYFNDLNFLVRLYADFSLICFTGDAIGFFPSFIPYKL